MTRQNRMQRYDNRTVLTMLSKTHKNGKKENKLKQTKTKRKNEATCMCYSCLNRSQVYIHAENFLEKKTNRVSRFDYRSQTTRRRGSLDMPSQ